jgi:hypothetical protein
MAGGFGPRPGYGSPDGMGGMMGVEDWRLPPLPELDLPPGWEDMRSQGYNSMPPQDQMGNVPRSVPPRPLLPPQRASGRGSNFGQDYHLDPNNTNGWGR